MPPQPPTNSIATATLAGLGIGKQSNPITILDTIFIDQDHADPLGAIEEIVGTSPQINAIDADPRASGWLILLSYELGRLIEPKANARSQHLLHEHHQPPFPLAVLQRWVISDAPLAPEPGGFTLGSFVSRIGKEPYIAAVERTKAYIRAGDIYQANITHPLVASFSGDAHALFSRLAQVTAPRMGAVMAFEYHGLRHAIVSISPELFLECDFATGHILTEPMKGTRPLGSSIAELRDAPKDQAELNMITDLMRNDLGRLCVPGSVRVINPRKIESHRSGVLQATAIIEGRLNPGLGLAEMIRATFPPGSITGAPKVRAMQIIDELEPLARGPYCGSLLMLNDAGQLKSSVTIRTAHIWGEPCPESPAGILNGQCVYPVGAGIVADSVPAEEWEETLLKARALDLAHDPGDMDDPGSP